jgi:hypothetical protein
MDIKLDQPLAECPLENAGGKRAIEHPREKSEDVNTQCLLLFV